MLRIDPPPPVFDWWRQFPSAFLPPPAKQGEVDRTRSVRDGGGWRGRHDLSFRPVRTPPGMLWFPPLERGSGARRSAPWVVQRRIAAAVRVATRPDRPFLPGVAVGVADRHTKGEAPGALAPLPVTGATCQGLAETALDPPVQPPEAMQTAFVSPRNRMGGRIRPPAVVIGLLEGALQCPPHAAGHATDALTSEASVDFGPPSRQDARTIAWAAEGGDGWCSIPHLVSGLSVEGVGKSGFRAGLDSAESAGFLLPSGGGAAFSAGWAVGLRWGTDFDREGGPPPGR